MQSTLEYSGYHWIAVVNIYEKKKIRVIILCTKRDTNSFGALRSSRLTVL